MLKSWWSEADLQVVMPPLHWPARASTSCSSKHPNSLGPFISISEFHWSYTPSRRYHIGESLLSSARHYLKFIGADEKVANHGFERKVSTHHDYPAHV